MVGIDEWVEWGGEGTTRDRAQLVLVGAIAIAVILVGITIVINSAVFTENVAGGSSVAATNDVSKFDREAVRNVKSLTIRVNHGKTYTGGGPVDVEDDVRSNMSAYSQVLSESYADTSSVYVNVTLEEVDKIGTRFIQEEDSTFGNNGPPPNPPPATPTVEGPFQLGWFVINFDVKNVSQSERLYISLTNDTAELNVSVKRSPANRLQVNSSIDGDHVSNVTCTPQNGRVLLDVEGGSSYSGDCTFNSTEFLDPPYDELEFVQSGAAEGKYDIVVNDSSSNGVGNACVAANPVDFPCVADAVWSLNFTTKYRTGSTAYERTHNVTVYDT